MKIHKPFIFLKVVPNMGVEFHSCQLGLGLLCLQRLRYFYFERKWLVGGAKGDSKFPGPGLGDIMLEVGKLERDYFVEIHKQDGNHCYHLKLFQLCFVSSGFCTLWTESSSLFIERNSSGGNTGIY